MTLRAEPVAPTLVAERLPGLAGLLGAATPFGRPAPVVGARAVRAPDGDILACGWVESLPGHAAQIGVEAFPESGPARHAWDLLVADFHAEAIRQRYRHVQCMLGADDVATADRLEWHALPAAGPALHLVRDNAEPFEPPIYKPKFSPALDREFSAEILTETYEGSRDFPELGETADAISVQFEVERFHRRGGKAILIVVGGEAVGVIQVMEEPDDGLSLTYLGVLPDYRRRGIAAGALAEILRGGFTPRRPREVTLWVDGRNAPALRLYEGFGFRLASAHRLHVGWRYGNA